MKEINPIRVRDLLGHIADAQRRLRELGRLPEEEFLADYRNTESAKYLLMVAAKSAIDIGNHIVSHLGGRAPKDYADTFAILHELRIIDLELAKRLQKMARFRNMIVHLYWDVDNQKVYQIIQNDLDDLDAFRQAVQSGLFS